jgi:hypothetical protein
LVQAVYTNQDFAVAVVGVAVVVVLAAVLVVDFAVAEFELAYSLM